MQSYHITNNPGFARSYVSVVQNFDFSGFAEKYETLESSHKGRVLAIWGEHDTIVPTNLLEDLKKLIPSLESKIIGNSSHSLPIERPDLVVETISQFLSGK